MATSRISLDPTQYVRVNRFFSPVTIEANEGEIRVVVTQNQPAVTNTAFHRVTDRQRLRFEYPDTNIWVLATNANQKAVITEEVDHRIELLEIARGNVQGQTIFSKFGRNLDVDTTTDPEDVWNGGGIYTGFPTGPAETLEVFSSSANDTAGGTGARALRITNLLDANYAPAPDVTVTLNGLTPVTVPGGPYIRCNRAIVLTAGSSGHNEGGLTIRHTTTTANIFAVIPAFANQTAICAYTVPLGFTLYLNDVEFQMARSGGTPGSANVSLRVRPFGEVFQAKLAPTITSSSSFVGTNTFRVYPERTDIVARVDSASDNDTIVSANLGGILIAN